MDGHILSKSPWALLEQDTFSTDVTFCHFSLKGWFVSLNLATTFHASGRKDSDIPRSAHKCWMDRKLKQNKNPQSWQISIPVSSWFMFQWAEWDDFGLQGAAW